MNIFPTTEGPQGKPTESTVSSCCATQCETKWQAPERREPGNDGPATIREAQIAVSEVLGRLQSLIQQRFVAAGTEREQQAAIFICFFFS